MGTMGGPDTERLISLTNSDFSKGYIDNPINIKDDKIYIFSGAADTVVRTNVVKALQTYYQYFASINNIVVCSMNKYAFSFQFP